MDTIDHLTADLTSHHIEGYAHAAEGRPDGHFSMSLVTHIVGNLWMGGCEPGVRLPDDFAYVVSLYPWGKYQLGPNTVRVEHKLYDAGEIPDVPTLYSAAGHLLGCLRTGKTLVHCQAGLNRSGLVAGLALVLDGMPPGEAIALLRERRSPAVLCNRTFANWLLDQRPGTVGARPAPPTMLLADLLAAYVPGSRDQPWTWDDETADILSHQCPTTHAIAQGIEVDPCDDPEPGCYQRKLEDHLRTVGEITQPVCLGPDGRVWDGHHRIVAARRLGFTEIPIEDNDARA
jgi:hypothetical protein